MYTAGTPFTRLSEKCVRVCVRVSMEMILPQLHWNVCNVLKEEDRRESLLRPAVGPQQDEDWTGCTH